MTYLFVKFRSEPNASPHLLILIIYVVSDNLVHMALNFRHGFGARSGISIRTEMDPDIDSVFFVIGNYLETKCEKLKGEQ